MSSGTNSATVTSNTNNTPPARPAKGNWEIFPKRTASQTSLRTAQLNKLHLAIGRRDLAKLKKRLGDRKAKLELVEFDHMEQTPLTAALRLNLVEFVRELLEFYKQTKYLFIYLFVYYTYILLCHYLISSILAHATILLSLILGHLGAK